MPKPDWNRRYVQGKGSWRRPEDKAKFDRNHDRIFAKKKCCDCAHFEWISAMCCLLDLPVFDGPRCDTDKDFKREEVTL